MKKKNSKRIFSFMLGIIFAVISVCPSAAFAADEADLQGTGQVQQLQETDQSSDGLSETVQEEESKPDVDSEQDSSPQEAESDSTDKNTENGQTVNPDTTDAQADTQSMDDSLQKTPLGTIIANDAEGKEKIYTTLLDSENRIVDTNDPELERDNHYKSKEDGGEDGTVDLDAELKVRFRMAEVIEHDGDSGVQENVLYYMILPKELIPAKEDSAGKELVDPETPITFFQSGDIQCSGGIYTAQDGYELQMQFSNVEDELNISGAYQYNVTLSDQLEEGTKCTVSYVPGGTLSFNITPAKEEPEKGDEILELTGEKNPDANDKIDWTLTLTDKDMKLSAKRLQVKLGDGSVIAGGPNGRSAEDMIGLSSIVITYKDGHKETLNVQKIQNGNMYSTAYAFYREGAAYDATATEINSTGILGTIYTDYNENKLVSARMGKFLTDTLYIDMTALKSSGSKPGNTLGSENPDDIDLEICKYEFKFTSRTYDDYNISGNQYTATATMTDADETKTLASASSGATITYGTPKIGTFQDSASYNDTYFKTPSSIQTTYSADNKNYTGNYYSLEFAPQQTYAGEGKFKDSNNTNTIYYTKNDGFYESGTKNNGEKTVNHVLGTDGSAFEKLQVGDISTWTFCNVLTYNMIEDDNGMLWRYLDATKDLITAYQIKEVFKNMDPDDSVLLYRAVDTKNQRFIYMFVDPDTRNDAMASYKYPNGWGRLADKSDDATSAKAANWKIHIFNAPAQSLNVSFKQYNGASYANDQNIRNTSVADTMVTSNNVYGDTSGAASVATTGYHMDRPAASSLTGRWVDGDTIFWEMDAYAANISSLQQWLVYVKVPYTQTLCVDNSAYGQYTVDGNLLYASQMVYYTSDGKWQKFTGKKIDCDEKDIGFGGLPLTTDSVEPSITNKGEYANMYRVNTFEVKPYDGKHVKIGFFTKVSPGYTQNPTCQAEIVTVSGEKSPFTSQPWGQCYPFKISASGEMDQLHMSKSHTDSGHAEADEDGAEHITDTWTIKGSVWSWQEEFSSPLLNDTIYKGWYNGTWVITDDMEDSYAEDKDGNKIDVNPAAYTTLKKIKVSTSGRTGSEENLFELSEADMKEAMNKYPFYEITSSVNPDVKLRLYFTRNKGTMEKGFTLYLSGLENIEDVNIEYTTDFNQKAFFDAVEESGTDMKQFFTTVFTNGAQRGIDYRNMRNLASAKVKHRVVAALDINKEVAEVPNKGEGAGGYSAGYALDTQIGYTSSAYVDIEDFILGYTERADNTGGYGESDTEAMKALVEALQLSELTITATDVDNKAQQIYSGQDKNGTWTGSETDANWKVSFEYKPDTDHSGSLFKVKITKADGSDISADYRFTVKYKMTVCMDNFRDSNYYQGGNLLIKNGGAAIRTIKQLSDTPATQKAKAKSRAATQAQDDLTLSADCGGGVTVSYLADKKVNKTAMSAENSDVTNWMIYDWTGTKGKNDSKGHLTDELSYDVDDFSYIDPTTGERVTMDQLDDEAQQEIKNKIAGLLYKYTTFKNVKIYYTSDKPKDDQSNLSDEDLLYTFDGSFKGLDEEKNYEETVTDKNGKKHTIQLTTGKSESGQSVGFEATADHLDIDSYFAATYDTEIDWEKLYQEIGELYPQCSFNSSYKNTASNDEGAKKECVGSHIEVEGEDIAKDLISSDAANGKSSWQIQAFTGTNKNDELTIRDEVAVNTQDERIKAAAENAISVVPDSVVVKCGDKIVYKNQKTSEGWADDNISVQIDGRKLTVAIKNTDDSKVLLKNSTYTVQYDTVLDKDAYIANGGKAEDEITLQNTAAMEHGSYNGSSDKTDTVKPEIPVSAEKKYLGNGSDGRDQTTALWQAVAKTGDAGRKNFVMKDSVSCAQEDEKVQNALKLQDVVITVKTGQEEEAVYTTDNLPEGVTFIEEGAGFTLTFADIPKDTTVTVDYATHFDKDAYQKAGGEDDVKVDLNNAFVISSDDGYTASDDASGSIEYGKGFTKEGTVSSEKSSNGNPIIEWKMQVNLFNLFTAKEIDEMVDATITDNLSAILSVIDGSVKLTDQDGKDIPQDTYRVEQNGNVLKVILTDPKAYPVYNLEFKTECGASVNGLVNNASLSVNGKKVTDTSSKDVGKLEAANQYGWIQAMKAPEFTPVAYKYLDHELCTEKGLFQFSIEQVDAEGNPIENGYQDTASNDENGQITFKKITYRNKPIEGSYYYQIRETSEVEPYTYTIDERVFTIRVDVIASQGQYLVTYTVTDPENYDEVRFDNTTVTTRDFTVTKKWNDNDDKAGARPKSITVYLLNHGKRYNNMSVTLNEDNNWTYTWKDLPIADGDYSVEEAEVEHYTAEIETKDWSSVITNTYKPENPKEEEKPTNTDQPKDVDQPKNADQPKKEETSQNVVSNTPRTSDVTDQIALWMLLMIAALGVGIKAFKSKKNR